jgi:hypothetical protein
MCATKLDRSQLPKVEKKVKEYTKKPVIKNSIDWRRMGKWVSFVVFLSCIGLMMQKPNDFPENKKAVTARGDLGWQPGMRSVTLGEAEISQLLMFLIKNEGWVMPGAKVDSKAVKIKKEEMVIGVTQKILGYPICSSIRLNSNLDVSGFAIGKLPLPKILLTVLPSPFEKKLEPVIKLMEGNKSQAKLEFSEGKVTIGNK